MNISACCAQSIEDLRMKNYLFGLSSLVGLGFSCNTFVLGQNSFYELIFLSELIIGYFMMLVVLTNHQLDLYSAEYIYTMSYLIKESYRGNAQFTDQELEQMIKDRRGDNVSDWRNIYTCIKMDFHHFCCESKDFLFLVLSAGVVASYYFEQRFQSDQIRWQVILLTVVTAFDLLLVALGVIIELPRRIRQEYKLRRLQRRATRQLFFDMQNSSFLDNQEGQGSYLQNLLESELLEEEQVRQQKQIQDAPPRRQSIFGNEEEVMCQICYVEMDEKDNIQQLPCHSSHIFHSDCIQDWFIKNRQDNLIPFCPICRTPQQR